MKKFTLLSIASFCFMAITHAQITKGSTFLGGSLGYSSNSNEDNNSSGIKNESSNWSLRPQFGKAIRTNKIIGVFANYGSSKTEQTQGVNSLENKDRTYGGGIFLRNYYPLSSRFYLFGEGSAGVGFTKSEGINNAVVYGRGNTTLLFASITPGISFAAGRKVHLEASLNSLVSAGYSVSKTSTYDATGTQINSGKSKQFNAGVNANGFSNLSIGLRWILPRKN